MANLRMNSNERKEQIIEVATKLFSKKGFNGVKTREIAKRAKISEAIIFRHFNRKEDLYSAIINKKMGGKKEFFKPHEEALKKGDIAVFKAMARYLIRVNEKDPTLLRLLFFSALEKHKLHNAYFEVYVKQLFDFLSSYIKKRTKDNIFKKVNPEIAARALVGMSVLYVIEKEIFREKELNKFEIDEVVDTFVEIFLEGVRE